MEKAIEKGDEGVVAELIDRGLNINISEDYCFLQTAIELEKLEIAELLLNNGIKLNTRINDNFDQVITSLHYAATIIIAFKL